MADKVYTVQPRFKGAAVGSWSWVDSLFHWGTGTSIPYYPSPARDAYLAEYWKCEPVLAGAIATSVDRMTAANWVVKGGKVNASRMATVLHGAEGGAGWAQLISPSFQDFTTTNRGTIIELGRSSKSRRTGPVLGLQHLDSTRIMATNDAKKPWRYLPEGAEGVDLWAENVIQIMSLPASRDRFRGSGLCAVERLRDSVGLMIGWLTHDRQMVGNLPPEAIAIFNGLTLEKVQQTHESYIQRRNALMNSQGEANPIYAGFWMMGSDDPAVPVDVKLVNLRRTDQANRNAFYEWWVKLVALNLEQSVGQFWLIQHAGATKAVEGIHMEMERAKGPGRYARELEWRLNWNVMPSGVTFAFDAQDDAQDLARAEILGMNIESLQKMSTIADPFEGAILPLEELKAQAVEWGILPPEIVGESVPTVLGSQLKELSSADRVTVTRDFEIRTARVLTDKWRERFQEVAEALERAYAPLQHVEKRLQ